MDNNIPEPRGIKPYGDIGNWGHIDLLETYFGSNWMEVIKETSHWQRMDAGEQLSGLTGSVNWAICIEFRLNRENQ